jgi:hypothetical protein
MALAAGGVLVAGGVTAIAVGEKYRSIYNDDNRCFIAPETRDERCGVEGGIARTAEISGVVALSLGAVAAGAGTFLLLRFPSRSPRSTARSRCGVGLGGFQCSGSF